MSTSAPFTFEVVRDSLYAAAREMGSELVKIAHSTVVRESHDCATGITDARGRVVAHAPYTPGHFNSIPSAAKGVLELFPGDGLAPGDVVITNDPWICAGHLPDVFVFTPFFWGGELIALLASVAHQIDFGGKNPGGVSPNTTTIFEEGLQLPPVKLYDGGVPNAAVFAIIRQNVRLSETVIADIQAQMAVNERGRRRLSELCEKYGAGTVVWTFDQAIERSERLTRTAFSQIPPGTYRAEDFLDDDGFTDEPIPIRVAITVRDSELFVDFTGTGGQTLGGVNTTPSYRDAYTHMVIRSFTDPGIPHNEGCFAPVHISAPKGSLLNPIYPAAVAGRACVVPRIADVITSALSQALPDRAMAGYGGMMAQPLFSGADLAGRDFILVDNSHGGTGARRGLDGENCVSWPANAGNHSVEVIEATSPLEVGRYQLFADSEGAGRWRGGFGVIKEYRVLAEGVSLELSSDRIKFPAFGLDGGGESVLEEFILIRDGRETRLRSKGRYALTVGDVLRVRMPGGGGLEPPWLRPPTLVLDDVIAGLISEQRAEDVYGVIITEDRTVDVAKTAERRALIAHVE